MKPIAFPVSVTHTSTVPFPSMITAVEVDNDTVAAVMYNVGIMDDVQQLEVITR